MEARTPRIIEAFRAIDRKDFVATEYWDEAYADHPLPIGHGQTISQPYTVAYMLELLRPERGDRVLDVGSGSGWTTALLANIVGPDGRVWGTEIIPELVEFGRANLIKYNFKNATIERAAGLGLPEHAPYDKILVSASADELPGEFMNQLAPDGTMVIPIKTSVWKITHTEREEHPGFAFVPLIA